MTMYTFQAVGVASTIRLPVLLLLHNLSPTRDGRNVASIPRDHYKTSTLLLLNNTKLAKCRPGLPRLS